MCYWDAICIDTPNIYEKYLFGLKNIGVFICKLNFQQIDYIKRYLLENDWTKNYQHIWYEIIKHCPKLDTGAEMGNLGF